MHSLQWGSVEQQLSTLLILLAYGLSGIFNKDNLALLFVNAKLDNIGWTEDKPEWDTEVCLPRPSDDMIQGLCN